MEKPTMSASEYRVTANDHGQRLDVLLAKLDDIVSRNLAVSLIEAGQVSVNGQPSTLKRRILVEGDLITFTVENPAPIGLLPEYIDLDIRYEDDYLMVISKQAGLVCHPATGHLSGTLVNALIAHCGYENLAQIQGADRPGIVHRLDKDTSGLMLVAKTDQAGLALSDAIRLRELNRRYLTLVHGYVAADSGLIDVPILRGLKDRVRYMVSDDPRARTAVTSFQVLERYEAGRDDDGYCLLECNLFTGRTHQIRVHMAYTHHPCVGDMLYGRNRKRGSDELGLDRQFLHSGILEFTHPITGERLSFTDRIPDELIAALDLIRPRSMGLTDAGKRLLPLFSIDGTQS
ncbi:MAG: RluA family pseudouridine synthase [Coriobacteriia bacterium]|nr:RluA family pseudouridine synthase [Coriobacteriia bacterium]